MDSTIDEKASSTSQTTADSSVSDIESGVTLHLPRRVQKIVSKLESQAGFETRGIERVPEEMRHGKPSFKQYLSSALMWFGINCTANSLNVGILGPVVFKLGFVDAVLCCTFGTFMGCAITGYISSFGPVSGCRTLVISRYTMGWWPSRLCVLLNIVIALGYGVTNCLTAGLILSAVNGHGMKPWVGIVVSALITWVIATFGYRWFYNFERYCWIPQVLIMFVIIGCAGPNFNAESQSAASGPALAGSRMSYFFLAMSVPLSWASYAADYYAYLPQSTSRWKVAIATTTGLLLAKLLCLTIGIGLGSGLLISDNWAMAFETSSGALMMASLQPLRGFGKFLGVILALGLVANQVPGAYSASFNFQLLGSWTRRLPRFVWSTISVLIYAICAIAGEKFLLAIFQNFLAIVGYWTMIWVVITVEEHVAFRRGGFDWETWNEKKLLPIGIAALGAFCVGWVGSVLAMSQVYFTGPIAALVGHGADMGLVVGAAWTAVVFPPLRYLEKMYFKR